MFKGWTSIKESKNKLYPNLSSTITTTNDSQKAKSFLNFKGS